MGEAVVLLGSAFAGFVAGAFYGFCWAAQVAVSVGYSAPAERPLLSLLISVNYSLSFGKALFFLLLFALSLALFVACIGAPAVLAPRLAPGTPAMVPISYIVLFALSAAGWAFGKHVWRVVS
jgi:hypothetical protein